MHISLPVISFQTTKHGWITTTFGRWNLSLKRVECFAVLATWTFSKHAVVTKTANVRESKEMGAERCLCGITGKFSSDLYFALSTSFFKTLFEVAHCLSICVILFCCDISWAPQLPFFRCSFEPWAPARFLGRFRLGTVCTHLRACWAYFISIFLFVCLC